MTQERGALKIYNAQGWYALALEVKREPAGSVWVDAQGECALVLYAQTR